MAVRIRLRRMGNRNNHAYRIVVCDSRVRRDGRFIEILGHYNPVTTPAEFQIKEENAINWLRKGAVMSDTVRSLFKRQGILQKFTGVTYASLQQEGEEISKKARKRMKAKAEAEKKAGEEKKAKPAEAATAEQQQAPAAEAEAETKSEE